MKRIVTAKEQFEMLSPWRVAAPNSRSKVRGWRGSPSPQRQLGHRDIVRQTADDNGWTLDSGYEGDDFPSFESYRRGDGEELAVWYTHPGGKVYRALQKTLHSFDQNGKPFHVINKLQSEPNKKQWVIDALSEPAWTPIRKAHKAIQAASRTAMEWHSEPWLPGNAAGNDTFKLKDHLPSDYDFLNPGGTQPKYKRQMGFPLDPTGKWYHVSPHKLNPGDQIVPSGGQSPSSDFYGADNWNRQYHVWMSPNVESANWWRDNWTGKDSYIYEVKPGDRPQPWNFSGNDGWVAPSATVTREITASVEDDIMEMIGPPVRRHNPATDLPPAPRRDPYEHMREVYKDLAPKAYDVMIPTHVLDHYREYSHPYDHKLEEIIREQGIREPVRISTNGTHAIISEGNHRLDIAQKLGIPAVPARVYVNKDIARGDTNGNDGGRPPAPLEPFLKKFIDTNRDRLESFWG